MWHKQVLVLVLVVGGLYAGLAISRGQQPSTDPVLTALDERVARFFDGVSTDEVDAAYGELLGGSQLARQSEAIKSLSERTKELAEKYGAYRDLEQVDAVRIGDDVAVLKYLYKCERFPVVWYFTFYRTARASSDPLENPTWVLVTVRFDTELELLALGRR